MLGRPVMRVVVAEGHDEERRLVAEKKLGRSLVFCDF
jgi:hypothetical protein